MLLSAILVLAIGESANAQSFQVDDIIISDTTTGYIDPEFVRYRDSIFVTYALSNTNILVGHINPSNGLFPSNYGRNIFVDRPWAPISMITNGPEWGLSSNGPVLYYTKMKSNGNSAVFKITYPFKSNSFSEVVLDTGFSYAGACGSINEGLPQPDLWFYKGQLTTDKSKWQTGGVKNVWMNAQSGQLTELDKTPVSTIRWAHYSPFLVYSHTVSAVRQIFILNTQTNTAVQATFDSEDKTDPWGFFAPEYNNEFCLMANIRNRYLRIYRDLHGLWSAVDSLQLPTTGNRDTLMTSVEPIYGGRGFNGISYFTVQANNGYDSYSSIWLLGLGNKLQRRLDEGSTSGRLMERYDPESIIGTNEVFVYYTEQHGTSQIRRCRTGLTNSSYQTFSDIPYDTMAGVDRNLLSLDIYRPNKGTDGYPVMVYVHGGYWRAGDKLFVGDKAKLFTDSGYVFVSVNYRLSPDPPDTSKTDRIRFPDHPKDLAKAIKWIHSNITPYGGDKEKLFLIGHSAGAHLVLLVSTNSSLLDQVGLSLRSIKGTVPLDCGAFDVAEEIRQGARIPERVVPLVNAFGNNPVLWNDASPQMQIVKGTTYPPILLVHQNTSDRVYSNVRFVDSMKAIGNNSIYAFNAEPYDHGQINTMLGSSFDSNGETRVVMNFFRTLRSATTPVTEQDIPARPMEFALYQNYPNPFNPSTIIRYHIPRAGHVTLRVFDVLGRTVATLVDDDRQPGVYQCEFSTASGGDAAYVALRTGVLFYQLKAGTSRQTNKMMVLQ